MLDFVKAYDKQGVTKQLKFDAKGESADIKVFAYKVEGGKIVSDRRDQVTPTSSMGGGRSSRLRPPPVGDARSLLPPTAPGPGGLGCSSSSTTSVALTDHRPHARRRLRARRPRLHPRLRRAAPHQLRPLRGVHVRHLRGAVGGHAPRWPRPAAASGRSIFWVAMMFVAAMAMSGFIAVLLERVAYRPLRKRNAPPLIALISADRRLVRPRRDHGSAQPHRRLGRAGRQPERLRRATPATTPACRRSSSRSRSSRSAATP